MRYVGVCNYQAWQVCQAMWLQERLHASPLITIQNPYSLLNRGLELEHFPMARALGLGIMAYAPLATGLLSGTYDADVPPPTIHCGARAAATDSPIRSPAAPRMCSRSCATSPASTV